MTLSTGSQGRQQAEEPWDWILAIRAILLDRIEALSITCEDPRELTDLAAMLARVNKKIEVRLPHSATSHRTLRRRPPDVAGTRLEGVPR